MTRKAVAIWSLVIFAAWLIATAASGGEDCRGDEPICIETEELAVFYGLVAIGIWAIGLAVVSPFLTMRRLRQQQQPAQPPNNSNQSGSDSRDE